MTLNEYLDRFETQTSLAKRLGVQQSLISQWVNGMPVAVNRIQQIVDATGGRVTAKELRQDVAQLFKEKKRTSDTVTPTKLEIVVYGKCECGETVSNKHEFCPKCGSRLEWH